MRLKNEPIVNHPCSWRPVLILRDGQLLIESLLAISLLIVGFFGIFSLLSRSLSLNRVAADNYTATYLAAEGIEVARNILDSNVIQKKSWNDGFNNGDYEVQYDDRFLPLTQTQDRFLAFDPADNTYSYGGGSKTNFKRVVRILLVGDNEIKINSIVSWITLGGGSYKVNLEDHFLNWHPENP